ncbi:MAG: hypothetical protein ACK6DC_18375, partial [Planctomycetota bacterium]
MPPLAGGCRTTGGAATAATAGTSAFSRAAFPTGTPLARSAAIGLRGCCDQVPARAMQAGIDVAADFAKGISINVLNLDRDLFGLLGEGLEQT